MRPKKAKIQAQRKFAQGYVPPNLTPTTLPIRPEATPPENVNIIHTHMNANRLLDKISLQGLINNQPVVVLRRLPAISAPVAPTNDTIVPTTATRSPGKVVKKKSQKTSMCLRSKSAKTSVVKPKRRKVATKSPQKTASDTEDEQPLQYFKRLDAVVESAASTRGVSPTLGRSNSSEAVIPDAVVESAASPRGVSPTLGTSNASEAVIPDAVVESAASPRGVSPTLATSNASEAVIPDAVVESAASPRGVSTTLGRSNAPEAVIPGFKKPAVPLKRPISKDGESSRLRKKARIEVPVPREPRVTSEYPEDIDMSSDPSALSSSHADSGSNDPCTSRFYTKNTNIENWMDLSTEEQLKHNLRRAVRKVVKRNGRRACGFKCPSESLLTVGEVLNTAENTVKRCKFCKTCKLVDKVRLLQKIVHKRRDSERDVYEFQESEHINAPFVFLKRQHVTANSSCKEPSNAPAAVDETFYLDILPNSSKRIIEIRLEKLINQPQSLMKARIVTKPEQHVAQDLNLIEHENILDQLLLYLNSEQIPSPTAASNLQFPKSQGMARVVEAPTFYLTEEEFTDPVLFYEKVAPSAAKFGICKVVAPDSFEPTCTLKEDFAFRATTQYITRLYSRWGAAARELCAIKAAASKLNVTYSRAPLLGGLEVNLAKLYMVVQRYGGLKQVMEKKRWNKVAEEMRFTHAANAANTLDRFYVKYLLPYDTLSTQERQQMTVAVEKCWNKRNQRMLNWALNPLHQQKKTLGESDSSDEEPDENEHVSGAINEAEDSIVTTRTMNLASFKKVATNALQTFLPSPTLPCDKIEDEYWRLVLLGIDHVCVRAASIDTGDSGYGFSKSEAEPCGTHPWNLKMLSKNPANVLRSLGAVLGVTVPTLHLGMVYSTSCWHRDPHGLPWVEYMHEGPTKIWYGIPNEHAPSFRSAVESLCPTSCQNKAIWLPSDITMIPPNLLCEHKVSLSRVEQKPGEYVIVFPKAYSCSISTGYTVSESVYFATNSWLRTLRETFQEVRESCEPTAFSIEQLLIALASDKSTPVQELSEVHTTLVQVLHDELSQRSELVAFGLPIVDPAQAPQPTKGRTNTAWNVEEQDECQICRKILYLSKVTGLISKKSTVCLQHALHLLKGREKKCKVNTLALVLTFTEKKLNDLMQHIQRRLSD